MFRCGCLVGALVLRDTSVAFQMRSDLSVDPEMMRCPSGLNATPVTASWSPTSV